MVTCARTLAPLPKSARFAWIPESTTAIAGASLSHLGYLQVDATIVNYNQAAARLESLRDGWHALRPSF